MKSRISSSLLNTYTYLARSRRVAAAIKDGSLSFVDKLPPKDWRNASWNYEADRLQYYLTYSNSGHTCPEELLSAARGREVTAELLEEEAAVLTARAATLSRRADILERQFYQYRSKRYWEEAYNLREEIEYLEAEAANNLDNAADCRDTAEFFRYEAENVFKEELYISKWEELYDMI